MVQSNPGSAPAVAGLERLAATGSDDAAQQAAVARLTLPFYERTDNAAKMAAANQVLLSVADTRGERVERLEKLRALYSGPLGDAAGAYRASLALFEIDPGDAPNRGALIAFSEKAGATAELCDSLRAASEASTDRHLRRDLLVIVAELEEKRLGRAPERREGLRADPAGRAAPRQGAFRALARLYRDGQHWPELRALLDTRQLASLEPRERLDLLAQIAELDESALGDAEHALSAYEKMLELDPADLRAHRALDRHYATQERWSDLEILLGTRVGFACASEVPELEFRRADLRAGRLGGRRGRARSAGGHGQGRPRPRRGAAPAREAAGAPRPAPARRQDPRAGLRGRAGPGRDWPRSSRLSARRWRAPRRRLCWRGSPGCRRTVCRRGPRRSRPGARCWRPIPTTAPRWPRSSAWRRPRTVLRARRRISGARPSGRRRPI